MFCLCRGTGPSPTRSTQSRSTKSASRQRTRGETSGEKRSRWNIAARSKGEDMRVFVAGANGAVGSRLIPLIVSAGHSVLGLVRRRVSVIAAGGSPASALAAKSATTTIPIVFMNAADPVRIGLVATFNRPGGNVTGATLLSAELVAKRVGILRDLLPSVKKFAMLVNPTRPGVDAQKVQVQEAAQALGLSLHILEADSERDFDAVFQAVVRQEDGALVVAPDALFLVRRAQIADLAIRYRIPTMYELREYVEAGGLVSYGASTTEEYQHGGTLTGQILLGKKPADLPVLQPTKFELAINMKTAKALGLTISSGLLRIADELIE